ncbi:MAG TPA: CoA transferase [Baekduia sp.]|jgi:crotonobetainyl-CoA:carnitine CoA-transferase CaiB-like acyl-CoA transferase
MSGPYAGIQVFDLSHVIAGPFCTRLMADMGADVIRVEQPAGDMMRQIPYAFDGDLSSAYAQYNNGKRAVGLDLKSEAGRELALRLVEWSDIVVQNFRPGVMASLGLSYEDLCARSPDVILCSLSTFGAVGPYAHLSGFGLVAEAYSGLMSLNGEDGGPPMHFGTALSDVNSGVHALAAIGAALHHRSQTGEGTHIDISAFDTLHAMIDQAHALGAFTHGERAGGRYGRRHATSVPSGVVQTADGRYVSYGMSGDVYWAKMAAAMGRPELRDDPRFAGMDARLANAPAAYDLIEAWAAEFATADALVDHLLAHGLSAARVRTVAENLADPHLVARGSLAPVAFDGAGEVLMQTAPYRFSGLDVRPGAPAGHVGEQTADVLRDVLGLDDAAIKTLFKAGSVHGTGGEEKEAAQCS